ncbi:MAG: hypothetical protein QNL80_03560 [Akkermansiaceae bacterium]
MKNATLVPLLAVTAASAFGLGWIVRPSGDDLSQDAGGEKKSMMNAGERSVNKGMRGGGGGVEVRPEDEFVARFLTGGKISSEDMQAAIKEMSEVNDPLLRQKMLAALLENLTADNAKDAFLALRENRSGGPFGRGGDNELRLLSNAWGRIDGPGAMAALKEIAEASEGEGRRGGRGGRGGPGGLGNEMVGALSGWATVDGAAATAYLDTIEDDRQKGYAGFGVIQGLLVNGVDEAMGFVQGLPKEGENNRAQEMYMGMIAGEMLEQGEDVAKSWVDSVADPDLKSGALTRVTMELMEKDREGTAEWLVKYGDDDSAARAVGRLADSWSREDPVAVLEWADQLSGETKVEAYEEAFESWTREDPTAAGEYLGNLAASPERDSATEAYATRISRENPVAAMEWAGTIANEEMRQDTVVEVAQDWYRSDKAAAEAWIATSGLPEESVQSITEQRRDRGMDFGGGGPRGGR